LILSQYCCSLANLLCIQKQQIIISTEREHVHATTNKQTTTDTVHTARQTQ
jgi:hypothetical protein